MKLHLVNRIGATSAHEVTRRLVGMGHPERVAERVANTFSVKLLRPVETDERPGLELAEAIHTDFRPMVLMLAAEYVRRQGGVL